jgi:hypothetical protein
MPQQPKDPLKGIDLAAARKELAGLPARRLDSDWLAMDRAGKVAFFAANERGPIPRTADTARVSEALEATARAAAMQRESANTGYRELGERVQEPVFDLPVTPGGDAAHEIPASGYPLLVVGSDPRLREVATEWNVREAMTRTGFGLVFPVVGPATYEEIHDGALCLGCRVIDDPADPRPRSPEALAAAGIHSYVHTGDDPERPYRRVAAPTVSADLVDLEPVVQLVASVVKLPVLFDDEPSLRPSDFEPCD